jgi:hypothetical protein
MLANGGSLLGSVEQYHEEGPGQRTTISLGKFNEADHLAWLEAHPSKVRRQ